MTTYTIAPSKNRHWEIWAHIEMTDNLGKTATKHKILGICFDKASADNLVHVLTVDEDIQTRKKAEIAKLRKDSKMWIGWRGRDGAPGWEEEVDLPRAIEIIYRECRIYEQLQDKILRLQEEIEKLRKEEI